MNKPTELFSQKVVCADGSMVEVVAYTWDNVLFQVDIITGGLPEDSFCEFVKKCSVADAIAYAKKRVQEIEIDQLRERVFILERKNQIANNIIAKKVLAIARDMAASYGELRNAVTIASRILA